MSKTFKTIICFIFSLLLIICPGCGRRPVQPLHELIRPPVWPSPPETARIKYLYSISTPDDIGWVPSFFERTLGFFAGPRENRQLVKPFGIFFSRKEVLYVADPGIHMVHIFNLKEHQYDKITKFGKTDFVSPIGVVMDEHGNLYVSDSILRRVFVYDPEGEPVMEIGKDDRMLRPTGIAINPSLKRLYVVDTVSHSVKVFNLEGKFLFDFGKRGNADGEFNFPTSLTIDRKGCLYVNDSLNFRVQVFDPDGRFVSLFGKHGDGMGEFSLPKGVALDSQGHIYVADAIFDSVQIFNSKGALLLYFGEAGHGPGNFWIPTSIFIDHNDRIFVSDSFNQRVQVFRFVGGSRS